mgnify:CR=1 FL=1
MGVMLFEPAVQLGDRVVALRLQPPVPRRDFHHHRQTPAGAHGQLDQRQLHAQNLHRLFLVAQAVVILALAPEFQMNHQVDAHAPHNRTDAEKLEGHFCLVRTSCLPENYMDKQDIDLTGFSVVDENAGCIGRVVRIDENPAHALLVVDRGSVSDSFEGREDEVLIPLVDEFLVAVEEEMGEIRVSLPDGLLDL